VSSDELLKLLNYRLMDQFLLTGLDTILKVHLPFWNGIDELKPGQRKKIFKDRGLNWFSKCAC